MEITSRNVCDTAGSLLEYITEIPGIRYRELLRLTGMTNGVLTYHLTFLEKSNSIRVYRKNRMTRYYPIDISFEESIIIGLLKNSTARHIILFILEHDLCSFNEVVRNAKKAPSTVSWHLKRLRDVGMISVSNGEYLLYSVKNKQTIVEILLKYRESFLDRIVDNYVAMIE